LKIVFYHNGVAMRKLSLRCFYIEKRYAEHAGAWLIKQAVKEEKHE